MRRIAYPEIAQAPPVILDSRLCALRSTYPINAETQQICYTILIPLYYLYLFLLIIDFLFILRLDIIYLYNKVIELLSKRYSIVYSKVIN